MNPGHTPGSARLARIALTAVAVCAALAGCAKRATQVDAGYTTPEGVASPDARMVMWFATTTTMNVYTDVIPLGPSINDPLVGTQTIVDEPVGSIHGLVFDRTDAGSFQILRREPGGGVRPYEDFAHTPSRKWIETQWEVFRFDDPSPSAFSPPSYIGRGLINGSVSSLSPVSNPASLASTSLGSINVQVTLDAVPGVDTISVIRWDTVAGATDYLIQIYELRNASVSQQQASALSGPLYEDQSRDHFLLWFRWGAGSVAQYKLGDTTRTDLDILYQRRLQPQPNPSIPGAIVRVSAFDPDGRMIATSRAPTSQPPGGDPPFPRNFAIAPVSDTEYGTFLLGGLQVERLRFPRPR